MTAGTPTESQPETPFALVEIDAQVTAALAKEGRPACAAPSAIIARPPRRRSASATRLQITLWEAASGGLFSSPAMDRSSPGSRSAAIPDQAVGRDGSVTVPYAGRIHVVGRTQQEVEAAIVERLRGKAIEPQALVNVSRNISNTATVTGEVTQGARVPLTLRGDRVMDVIAQAGGFRSPVHETFVSLTRGDRTARAPIQALLANPRENIFVRPGDMLTVERTPQTFTVAGATGANAVVPFDARGITLEEAIGKAGGLTDQRADPSGLFVLRYEPIGGDRGLSDSVAAAGGAGGWFRWPIISTCAIRRHCSPRGDSRCGTRTYCYVSNAPLTEIAQGVPTRLHADAAGNSGRGGGRGGEVTGARGGLYGNCAEGFES